MLNSDGFSHGSELCPHGGSVTKVCVATSPDPGVSLSVDKQSVRNLQILANVKSYRAKYAP